MVFAKPADALAGTNEVIPIHKDAQSQLDHEGELTVVVGKDCKNLPKEFNHAEYVLEYTIGNDVSARNFQVPGASGGEFCYAKPFDKFAPIGLWITSPKLISDPQALKYTVRVNGEVRQETGTDDMIWKVRDVLAASVTGHHAQSWHRYHTGTPSEVGFSSKKFLKDGDEVEVEIEGEMKLVSMMKFL